MNSKQRKQQERAKMATLIEIGLKDEAERLEKLNERLKAWEEALFAQDRFLEAREDELNRREDAILDELAEAQLSMANKADAAARANLTLVDDVICQLELDIPPMQIAEEIRKLHGKLVPTW